MNRTTISTVDGYPEVTSAQQDLADTNILAAMREHARWQPGSKLVEQDGLLLMADASGFPAAFRNCIARIDRNICAKDMLTRAAEFFDARQRSFTVFVRDSRDRDIELLLRERGYTLRFNMPCMLTDTPLAMPALPPKLRIETFETEQHIRDAITVLAEAYQAIGLPSRETSAYFPDPVRLIANQVRGCVAYEGNAPLATALTIDSPDAAGVYWVGTASSARRLGLASACTAFMTNDALARGARLVTLQASAFGEPVYRRLGYRDCDRFKLFRHLG